MKDPIKALYKENFLNAIAAIDFLKKEQREDILKDIEELAKAARKEVKQAKKQKEITNYKYRLNLKYDLWNDYEIQKRAEQDPEEI